MPPKIHIVSDLNSFETAPAYDAVTFVEKVATNDLSPDSVEITRTVPETTIIPIKTNKKRKIIKNKAKSMENINILKPTQAVASAGPDLSFLKIPDLNSIPTKPKFRVQFNLDSIGTYEAWYHWVNVHDKFLFLIYDTRFEFGLRYSPPYLGTKTINVILPDLDKSYNVYSLNITHPFGVFSITTLPIVQPVEEKNYGPPTVREIIAKSNNFDTWQDTEDISNDNDVNSVDDDNIDYI